MIAIRRLEKVYSSRRGGVVAVNRIDLDVGDGEFCVLLGPSGCGKTTTLRCVAGLERPDGGEIHIGGIVVADPDCGIFLPPERRDVSMVFQSYAIWPHMTVFENVAFPLSWGRRRLSRALVSQAVDEALSLVKLERFGERPATDLSGGQQQRVALARALALKSKVILMDEPLSNLDARLREEMRIELKRLTSELRLTTLYVTHDQIEALSLADKVCVMNEGHILQTGKPEEIYKNPNDRFVSEFLGQTNLIPGRLLAPGWVDCTIGRLPVELPDSLPPGTAVTMAIRPELVELKKRQEAGQEARGLTKGRITIRSFLGNSVLYEVRVGDATLRVQARDDSFLPPQDVYVEIPTGAWKVFPG